MQNPTAKTAQRKEIKKPSIVKRMIDHDHIQMCSVICPILFLHKKLGFQKVLTSLCAC